jgi:hypothetical protein
LLFPLRHPFSSLWPPSVLPAGSLKRGYSHRRTLHKPSFSIHVSASSSRPHRLCHQHHLREIGASSSLPPPFSYMWGNTSKWGPGDFLCFAPRFKVRAVKAQRSRADRATGGPSPRASSGLAPAGAAVTSRAGGSRPGVRVAAALPPTLPSSGTRPRPAPPHHVSFSPRPPFRDLSAQAAA